MNSRTALFHIEWWTPRSGRDVLVETVRAARHWLVDESIHPYNADVLDYTPSGDECDLFFSAVLRPSGHPGVAPVEIMHDAVADIRDAGLRVKMAMLIPNDLARAPLAEVWAWDAARLREMA